MTVDPLTGIVTWQAGEGYDERSVTVRAANMRGMDEEPLWMVHEGPG
ncbi:MAG: hypothetical protein HUU25_02110 [Candidatus Sumerlaeia bacterium]|nr:hypothetical protein [Candidatus Sumerlaeia bacterium]